jgi:hypothetical protein
MRFAITARALVKQREREEEGQGSGMSEILAANIRKVTRYRAGGEQDLEEEIRRLEGRGKPRGMERRVERRENDRREREAVEADEEEGEGFVERTSQGNDLMRRRR